MGPMGPRGTPGALYLEMNLLLPGGPQGPKGPNGTQGAMGSQKDAGLPVAHRQFGAQAEAQAHAPAICRKD